MEDVKILNLTDYNYQRDTKTWEIYIVRVEVREGRKYSVGERVLIPEDKAFYIITGIKYHHSGTLTWEQPYVVLLVEFEFPVIGSERRPVMATLGRSGELSFTTQEARDAVRILGQAGIKAAKAGKALSEGMKAMGKISWK